jgi:hypothetical protein
MSVTDHKAIVREEFTRQANAYANAAIITDEDRLVRLVAAIDPEGAVSAQSKSQPGLVMSRWRWRRDAAKWSGST